MKARQSACLEMFRRAAQFIHDQLDQLGAFAQCGALLDLEAAIQDLTDAATRQSVLRIRRAGQTVEHRELRRCLVQDHMRPIAAIAAFEAFDVPELQFRLRYRSGDYAICSDAALMAQAVERYVAGFIDAGLPLDFVEQLRSAADDLAQSTTARVTSHHEAVATTVEIGEGISCGLDAIRALNALLTPTLRSHGLAARWRAAIRVSLPPSASDADENQSPPVSEFDESDSPLASIL